MSGAIDMGFARFRTVAFTAASLLAAGCSVNASDPTAMTEQAVTAPDAGTIGDIGISGTVVDATGSPVAGVTITLSGRALSGGVQESTVSDPSGAFAFSVASGSYTLTASGVCLEFFPRVIDLDHLKTSTTVSFLGSGDDPITNCFPAPNRGATSGALTISGTVKSHGQPVPGVKVKLSGDVEAVRVSDETGAYTFSVNDGSYLIDVSGACAEFEPPLLDLGHVRKSETADFRGEGCPPPPLALCPAYDTLFGFSDPATCNAVTTLQPNCSFDRLSSGPQGWGQTIPNDYGNINFVDCRFGQWNNEPDLDLFTVTVLDQWFEALDLFTLRLFGCPLVGTVDGPLPFALIPPLPSLKYTTADLQALSEEYIAGINQALSDNGSPALTAEQTAAFSAQLAYAASQVPGVKRSSTLTYSTCTP
jgi:hypothetical protein